MQFYSCLRRVLCFFLSDTLPPPAAEVVPIASIESWETIGTQTYVIFLNISNIYIGISNIYIIHIHIHIHIYIYVGYS